MSGSPAEAHDEDDAQELVRRVVENLDGEYGRQRNAPDREPLDTLVGIILSQQNSAVSALVCFEELKRRFPSWDAALAAPVESIEDAIRRGGLARIKAVRIHAILQTLQERTGSLDLGSLADRPVDEALAELLRLPGVGPKTARCVLLFALGVEVFPMDVHIFRIAERLGLIAPKTPDERAHRVVGALVPKGKAYSTHIKMIAHGRTVCRPTAPKCDACCIVEYCAFGQRRLAELEASTADPR